MNNLQKFNNLDEIAQYLEKQTNHNSFNMKFMLNGPVIVKGIEFRIVTQLPRKKSLGQDGEFHNFKKN